ncbi:MAG TPA: hypothetical protein VJ464_05825 [Blastocatellia bacterium]|nr:hypothetical protein [Blastocatellia bacterium]
MMMAALMASAVLRADARMLAQSKSDPQTVAKLAGILERSGYAYKKAADNIWVVNFKGNSLADVNVIVTSAEGLVVMAVVVAQKSTMKVTPEMMYKLLKLTHDIDRVKIGFDSDDDLFVRSEVSTRLFDLEEFKFDMQQVAAASDQIHAAIKPFLVR